MHCFLQLVAVAVAFGHAAAAERNFDFGKFKPGETPAGWLPFVAGGGAAGEWKVVEDEVTPLLVPLSANAPKVTRQAVLAQLSTDPTAERFPILMFGGEKYGDFKLTTRFKLVSGKQEQIAGVAFRIQDERNFYVVRVSALNNNLGFYKFVQGLRNQPVGPEIKIDRGVWHELSVECDANRIHVLLNGREAIPTMNDGSFISGKFGFFTKSDTVAYFGDTHITYKPLVSVAESLVADTMKNYPRLLGVRIFGATPANPDLHIVASNNTSELSQAATLIERSVLRDNQAYMGKEKDRVLVTMPLHDLNGEVIGVAKFALTTFKGETERNAFGRVRPIIAAMERKIAAAGSLVE
ncbi:MAG: DUF1080 domain-containing protein [Pedosphaera sp.]|nr:DUF1080 domain-containing protein [Pedosphaera sp.]